MKFKRSMDFDQQKLITLRDLLYDNDVKAAIVAAAGGGGGGGSFDSAALAAAVHAATAKTPVDGDEFLVIDSAASFGLKKGLWSTLKSTLATYFDGRGIAKLSTARNINGVSFDGTANITIFDLTKIGYVIEVSGSYPNRPAGTNPHIYFGADAPTGGGSTAGGGGAVNGLDVWFKLGG